MSRLERTPVEPFDPATMPLAGCRLIEASAGTGKTFSLAGLYLRLIIEEQLDVREVLVMTFTRAATQELRERLRTRLTQAAQIAALAADPQRSDAAERFAEAVIERAPEPREVVARRLQDAAARVDQATITTIHGFAQRAAGENAFDSALPFDRGEQIDDREIRREAAADYWRARVFEQPNQQAAAFTALWASPETLYADLREALSKPHTQLVRADPQALERTRREALRLWPGERARFVELLDQAYGQGQLLAKSALKEQLAAEGAEAIAWRIDAGLAGTADGLPALPAIVAELGADDGVAAHAKKTELQRFRPQDLAVMPVLARLQVDGRLAAMTAAIDGIRKLAGMRKRERRLFSFDDMIGALHAAVLDAEGGQALTAALRRTWPWALVDEFQDTDPVQYEILRAIYGGLGNGGRGTDRGGLILIGDPKQAIYGFRGGDVFAYLDAAADADGCYEMATNFRSNAGVLDGIASLFTHGGSGAFVLDGIDFRPVSAGRNAGDRHIEHNGQPLPGVTAWTPPADTGVNKGDVQARARDGTVSRVATLLAEGMVVASGERRRLRPGEVAVLVNSNREAAEMQTALGAAGVPAACIHQESVFAHDAAHDLLQVLRAAAAPVDASCLRVALTTPLFGYRLGDLVALDADDQRWAEASDRFQAAHGRWARSGVQAMLEPVLQEGAGRVLTRTDGERRMTDYLHVADRLQEAEHEVFGMRGLVHWLEEAIRRAGDPDTAGEVSDADRVRLADDAELVQVATVHKVKGLQFAVVFVPYAPWLGTEGPPPTAPPLTYHDANNAAFLDLGSRWLDRHQEQAVRERRAEQMRLLYVALTRAEEACFFVHAAANKALDGPLAWLLHRDQDLTAGDWYGGGKPPAWFTAQGTAERLAELAAASAGALAVEELPAAADSPLQAAAAAPEPGAARSDLPAPRPLWSVFSFSGLAGRMAADTEPVAGADDEPAGGTVTETATEAAENPAAIPAHPRGAGFGRAFHEIVERAAAAAWPKPGEATGPAEREVIRAALRRNGIPATDAEGMDTPITNTAAMVAATLHAPLPTIGPLATIPAACQRAEMEFFFRLGGASAESVLARMVAAGYAGARATTAPTALRGLMHGFIDLVVEHDGRYWLLDYKTNDLGRQWADYAPPRLAAAITEHHYDLQYLIYTVALHRHLRRRLPDYAPTTHLGGALYLFVRGLDASSGTGVHADRPDPRLVEELDALLDHDEVST